MYDSIVDRDLIVLADDVGSLLEPPKQSQKSSEERAADAIQKMSNLLGKSEHLLSFSCLPVAIEACNRSGPQGLQKCQSASLHISGVSDFSMYVSCIETHDFQGYMVKCILGRDAGLQFLLQAS